ncbi:hypothetical protein BD289DRAFT_443208, partial [Coniella lustricola]
MTSTCGRNTSRPANPVCKLCNLSTYYYDFDLKINGARAVSTAILYIPAHTNPHKPPRQPFFDTLQMVPTDRCCFRSRWRSCRAEKDSVVHTLCHMLMLLHPVFGASACYVHLCRLQRNTCVSSNKTSLAYKWDLRLWVQHAQDCLFDNGGSLRPADLH